MGDVLSLRTGGLPPHLFLFTQMHQILGSVVFLGKIGASALGLILGKVST